MSICDSVSNSDQVISINCALCKFHGNDDIVHSSIEAYVTSSIGRVHLNEICKQVSDMLGKNEIQMSRADVKTHIEEHMTLKGVVLDKIVRDLVSMTHLSRKSCFVMTEEHDEPIFEPKNVPMYLKTVDQLTNVLKMDYFKNR